jgi:hypothetical protein
MVEDWGTATNLSSDAEPPFGSYCVGVGFLALYALYAQNTVRAASMISTTKNIAGIPAPSAMSPTGMIQSIVANNVIAVSPSQ